MAAMTHVDEESRFTVATDGTVRGDDGDHGRLALSLRYAARLASQVEFLLDVGPLRELSSVSSRAIEATVNLDDAGEVGLSVRIFADEVRHPKVLTVVGGAGVHPALTHCIQRVQQVPGVQWASLVAVDKRVVGASLPVAGAEVMQSVTALPQVGVRALAVLDSIDEQLRESWVELVFERATLLLASIDRDCLVVLVDSARPAPFAEALDEVRAILAPYDLAQAATLAGEPAPGEDVPEAATPALPPPPPAGMRFRAVPPKPPGEARRGLFRR